MKIEARRIHRLLVANRGEIACRVMRTARAMGMVTIAVYSDADRNAAHVAGADHAVRIGESPARLSYLRKEAILEAARQTQADAIHPGYGFLSENADFAQAVCDAGLIFVGPTPASIAAMGSKAQAKALMSAAGVPLVPGYHGERQDPDWLEAQAEAIGYPVLIKASAGGGGKGMRRVDCAEDFAAALASCQREALSSFGTAQVLIERHLLEPRHVEVQVFGDQHGHVVSLLERDCSLQRRHQKVIEEAPAPGWSREARQAISAAAVAAARAVNYQNAGTVEFIVDTHGVFYFMEMNTRLQVEHPVTEMILGEDLVAWQLRVAMGEPLPPRWDSLQPQGHAVEVRLYAENPARGFLPSTGRLQVLEFPQPHGTFSTATPLRVDSGVREGDVIGADYDPMIAKVIAHGHNREEALSSLGLALARTRLIGPGSNLAFLQQLLAHPRVRAGQVSTGLIESSIDALLPLPTTDTQREALLAVAAAQLLDIRRRHPDRDGWRHAGLRKADPAALLLWLCPGSDPHARPVPVKVYWSAPGMPQIEVEGQRWLLVQGALEGTQLVAQFTCVASDPAHATTSGPAMSGLEGKAENLLRADNPLQAHNPLQADVPLEADVPLQAGLQLQADGWLRDEIRVQADVRWVESLIGGLPRRDVHVYFAQTVVHLTLVDQDTPLLGGEASEGTLRAPMPGKIIALEVAEGDAVEAGQTLLVMEAMKMEHSISAPCAAHVRELPFALGDQVDEAAVLVRLEPVEVRIPSAPCEASGS